MFGCNINPVLIGPTTYPGFYQETSIGTSNKFNLTYVFDRDGGLQKEGGGENLQRFPHSLHYSSVCSEVHTMYIIVGLASSNQFWF